jgi:hypothetical protein
MESLFTTALIAVQKDPISPFEVFAKMTGKDYFLNGSVALMG